MPNTYFTITVDTEADDAWSHPDRVSLKSMKVIPKFQALCEAYGIVPVYLLTYECATREEALTVLKPISDRGQCEIGYHFHAWTTPPFENKSSEGVDRNWLQAYQYELPDSLFYEKAECLLKAIQTGYNVRPVSHRAGRWGIDQRTVDWLVDNDFSVDTSVVPLLSLSGNDGKVSPGPSFVRSPMIPFIWQRSPIGSNGGKSLVEIPLTVYWPTSVVLTLLTKYAVWAFPGKYTALRVYHKLMGSKGQLRPDPRYPVNELTKILSSHLKMRSAVINMMIHSSELVVGGSPFSRTRETCDRVWENLQKVFTFVQENNIASCSISEIARHIEGWVSIHENPAFTS